MDTANRRKEGSQMRGSAAKSPSFNGATLNIMIRNEKNDGNKVSAGDAVNDQGEYMQSPERVSYYDREKYGSPILYERKKVSSIKKNQKKTKKKFSVNRNSMKNKKQGIERISEEKSSEVSAKIKKEEEDISSIQKNNQSQPAEVNNTVESMISGMEA
jgi:hypothetical protein